MHKIIDKYSVKMTKLILSDLWFEDSIESDSLEKLTKDIIVKPILSLNKGVTEIKITHAGTDLDPAFEVDQWLGYNYPTLIYHHGNNERPFDYGKTSKNTFKTILYPNLSSIQGNIITIRAPFHAGTLKKFTSKMRNLSNFTSMIAASTNLVEQLVQNLKNNNSPKITIIGLSLGGWVTNLHRSMYNSANQNIPIFAGAALDRIFVDSYYKKLVHDQALSNRKVLFDALNFEAMFNSVTDMNLFPVLAKYDQYIQYEQQKTCYSNYPIVLLEKGHITGALDRRSLFKHILNHIQ